MSRNILNDLKVTSALRNQRNPDASRLAQARGQNSLEVEFVQEMANALRRSEDKLLRALDALEEAYHAVEDAAPSHRSEAIEHYNTAQETARVARWEMIVHREAIGLRDSSRIRERYPIPSKLKRT